MLTEKDWISTVKRTERGWAGHFCLSNYCRFSRNTLLTCGTQSVIVSTIGDYAPDGETKSLGFDKYYETIVFRGDAFGDPIYDAELKSDGLIYDDLPEMEKCYRDANDMHEKMIEAMSLELAKSSELYQYIQGLERIRNAQLDM